MLSGLTHLTAAAIKDLFMHMSSRMDYFANMIKMCLLLKYLTKSDFPNKHLTLLSFKANAVLLMLNF